MPSVNFEHIIKEYHPMIYKICRVYADIIDFEDLYQEVLVNIWKSLKNFQGKSKLSTWIYRVTLNTAMTYYRNEKKRQTKTDEFSVEIPSLQDDDSGEKEKQIEHLYNAISQLKKEDRSVIILYLEEKSYEEISEITGLTISNVGVKINRIKKKLFELLKGSNNG
ncbi:MAG: sigma-70 family RNA polymerase sigma factor [Cyclobacteriaceae bacterium]